MNDGSRRGELGDEVFYTWLSISAGIQWAQAIFKEEGHHVKADLLPECTEGEIQEERVTETGLCWKRTDGNNFCRFILQCLTWTIVHNIIWSFKKHMLGVVKQVWASFRTCFGTCFIKFYILSQVEYSFYHMPKTQTVWNSLFPKHPTSSVPHKILFNWT